MYTCRRSVALVASLKNAAGRGGAGRRPEQVRREMSYPRKCMKNRKCGMINDPNNGLRHDYVENGIM